MRVGTKALGLAVTWRSHFIGPGSTVAATRDAVFLDVGGQLCPGVIDQHQDGTLGRSTAELVFRFPELVYGHLLDGWLDRRDAGQDLRGVAFTPVLVTHTDPDFDAMTACWLVRRLIEDGELPPEAEALAGYSALVDQGLYAVELDRPETATEAIHVAYLGLQNLRLGYAATVARGHALLDAVFAAIRRERTHLYGLGVADLFPPSRRPPHLVQDKGDGWANKPRAVALAVASWRALPEMADVVALVDADLAKFRTDEETATKPEVDLPAEDGGEPIRVRAFIASRPTTSVLNKYWVRACEFPYFVCPYADTKGGVGTEGVFGRVILSLDPNWRTKGGRRPTLRGLGFRLEQEEARARLGNAALDRGSPPRWSDGTCDNADPWYDGRGHEYGIIDSPRAGSVLPYAQVRAIATSRFWEVRLKAAEVYVALPEGLPAGREFDGAPPPKHPSHTTAAMRLLFDDCREIETGALAHERRELPSGMVAEWDRRRAFPPGTSPPFRLMKIILAAERGATLDALVHWLGGMNELHHGRIYTVAHVQFEAGAAALADPDRLLSRLCAASGTLQEQGRDVVLYNGRAIALSDCDAAATGRRADLLLELMIYAAFQTEALQAFTARILELLAGGSVAGGEVVRREFLMFHAKYVHHDVVFDGDAREVYAGLREALALPLQHAKTIADLGRLAQIERVEAERKTKEANEAAEGKTNLLLFLVGLTGILQAGTVAYGDVPMWQNVLVGVVIGAVGLAYYWVNYRGANGGR